MKLQIYRGFFCWNWLLKLPISEFFLKTIVILLTFYLFPKILLYFYCPEWLGVLFACDLTCILQSFQLTSVTWYLRLPMLLILLGYIILCYIRPCLICVVSVVVVILTPCCREIAVLFFLLLLLLLSSLQIDGSAGA